MTLEELKIEWSKDSQIDDIELDKSSLEVPKLHAKYTSILSDKILILHRMNMKMSLLSKDKWMWYNGKMDRDRIQELGWQDDPFDGLKILKTDFKIFMDADYDIQELKSRIAYLEVVIDFIKGCVENIKWRHQTIRNTIDWRKFLAGS